jgi:hypothetical protein
MRGSFTRVAGTACLGAAVAASLALPQLLPGSTAEPAVVGRAPAAQLTTTIVLGPRPLPTSGVLGTSYTRVRPHAGAWHHPR